jgi:DegV family protein with EDD domain
MAAPVRIVTDSSAVVPPERADALGIATVPLWLHLGDTSYRDGLDMAADEFYARLAEGERVSTSSPSPGDFLTAYRNAVERGAGALLVPTVARSFSAIHDAARVAAAELPDVPIEVLDTGSAVSGAGLIAIAAAERAAQGARLSKVVDTARKVAGRVELLATLRTLQYLRRSGRVPAVRAWAGDLLRIKPVIRLRDGQVVREPVSLTHEGAVTRIVEAATEGTGMLRAGVFHAGAADEAEAMAGRIRRGEPGADVFVTTFSPAMGAHTGPGVVGVAWWRD